MNVNEMNDDLILAVAKMVEEDESRASVLNKKRIEDVARVYVIAKKLACESGAAASYKLHEPYASMGYVSIVGHNLRFMSTAKFREAASLASNVEIYPLTNGAVRINFTFHGLTTPMK